MAARDIIQAAAGAAAATEANYIEDVFSTYLYTGTGASQTITNGIDLATKGGLVWIKCRSFARNHELQDTLRGAGYRLQSSLTNGTSFTSGTISSFNSNGFTLGGNNTNYIASGDTFASWTFRKQPKFFDVVTYTGTGGNKTITHSLGATPGMIIVKRTDAASDWVVYHKYSSGGGSSHLILNNTSAAGYYGNAIRPEYVTNSSFRVEADPFNTSGATYVAYLFADSNSGGFGPAGTDSVVACGSYTGTGTAGNTITLGWEPQYILVKNSSSAYGWLIYDNMRGMPANGSSNPTLLANASDAESNYSNVYPTATGFVVNAGANGYVNTSGDNYIYLAIRRGPMKTPTDATKVFTPAYGVNLTASSGVIIPAPHVVDFFIQKSGGGSGFAQNRLVGAQRYLTLNDTSAEVDAGAGTWSLAGQSGVYYDAARDLTARIAWMFRRAPGFFDVVCYTGMTAARTVTHNLGVIPELIIIKSRSGIGVWAVWNKSLSPNSALQVNAVNAAIAYGWWDSVSPTATTFYTTANDSSVNASGSTYVAYLFATCPGVSKVFSFTGNGSSQTIDCGFTSGARFVLIKRTDSTGDWYVWDTARGINPGNDPHLSLNTTAAEVTTNDTIDTAGSGFIVNQVAATNVNVNNATYIGLAIA